MTTLVHDIEHSPRGVDRIIDRYRRPRTSALLASWLDEVQAVEDALWQLLVERSLETAEGEQLDVLGRIVGEPRRGRDDDTYRLWIATKNLVNRSSGTTRQMLTIARALIGPTASMVFEEHYPAAMVMRFAGPYSLDYGYQLAYMLHLAKPAGVLFQMTWPVPGEVFTFSPDDSPVPPDSPLGFDRGGWAVVADGSHIPIGGGEPEPEPEPEVPPGSLVIKGTPLTIDGAFIVVRPPEPIIAKPAVIVPRTTALAPVPAAVETIELEDAFADASLEMDAEGEHFRVATALQELVEGRVMLDFTLRATSVSSTDYEEIGVQRLDPTGFEHCTLRLVAEMDVAASGQVAELQLVDLNTGTEVATLSTDKTMTTLCSAVLTLPSVTTLYSVRLRRVGGNASLRAACRSVALELTNA